MISLSQEKMSEGFKGVTQVTMVYFLLTFCYQAALDNRMKQA